MVGGFVPTVGWPGIALEPLLINLAESSVAIVKANVHSLLS